MQLIATFHGLRGPMARGPDPLRQGSVPERMLRDAARSRAPAAKVRLESHADARLAAAASVFALRSTT